VAYFSQWRFYGLFFAYLIHFGLYTAAISNTTANRLQHNDFRNDFNILFICYMIILFLVNRISIKYFLKGLTYCIILIFTLPFIARFLEDRLLGFWNIMDISNYIFRNFGVLVIDKNQIFQFKYLTNLLISTVQSYCTDLPKNFVAISLFNYNSNRFRTCNNGLSFNCWFNKNFVTINWNIIWYANNILEILIRIPPGKNNTAGFGKLLDNFLSGVMSNDRNDRKQYCFLILYK